MKQPIPEPVRRALETLELPPTATLTDVKQAYRFLRDLYGTDSIATLPIQTEMGSEGRDAILKEVETAYQELLQYFEAQRHGDDAPGPAMQLEAVQQVVANVACYSGEILRTLRKMKGFRLEEVSSETRVPFQHLREIEEEKFDLLPPPVFTRGFVSAYAAFLGLDSRKVVGDFMGRMEAWTGGRRDKGQKSGKRFFFWRKKG